MAATLPPINKSRNRHIPAYGKPRQPPGGRLEPLNSSNNSPILQQKKNSDDSSSIKSHLPSLMKRDIAKYRNSYKHNLCLDMLTEGFHLSYCEIVNLLRTQNEKRELAGPESYLWTRPVLTDQKEKLNTMMIQLTKAEAASRVENFAEEYTARYELAMYLKGDDDDIWLVDHFFNTALDVAKKEENDNGKMEAEGHCNVGLCLQNSKNYRDAAKHFEAYHKLTLDFKNDWFKENGVSFYTDACINLYNIYTIIGNEHSGSNDQEEQDLQIETLKNALQMAKDSQDRKLEGEASYTLGMAYQRNNQLETALSHLYNFYESCQGDSNSEGIGRACDAIAKIYARQGNKEKSVEFLKRFVELTEKTGLEKEYCLACHNLGNVCNSVGNYEEATEYFSKAYNISRALADTDSTSTNRVQYGIALAHRMLDKFANHIVIADKTCMTRLVEWKSVRTDDFSKPIPDTAPSAAHHVVVPPSPVQEDTKDEESTKDDTQDDDTNTMEESGQREEGEGHEDELNDET